MPKRNQNQPSSSKTINLELYEDLTADEAHCIICRNYLTEPVTLPCNCTTRTKTSLCRLCFINLQDENMSTCNAECPVCRVRLSVWSRRNSKTGYTEAINRSLEKALSEQRKRLQEEIDNKTPVKRIANDGELQAEYIKASKKARLDYLSEREKEEKESLRLISLLDQDEVQAQERLAARFEPRSSQNTTEEQLKCDELLARRIFDEINSNKAHRITNDMTKEEAERIRKRARLTHSRKELPRLNDSFGSDRTDLSADLFRSDSSDSDDETDASASPVIFAARASLGSPTPPKKTDTSAISDYKPLSLPRCTPTPRVETEAVSFDDYKLASFARFTPTPPVETQAVSFADYQLSSFARFTPTPPVETQADGSPENVFERLGRYSPSPLLEIDSSASPDNETTSLGFCTSTQLDTSSSPKIFRARASIDSDD